MGAWIPLFVGILVLGFCVAVPFAIPSSPNRDLFKVCFVLTLICCYLMWAFTYLAQVNPMTNPIKKLSG